jgi:hypothetical protein
MLPTTRAHIVKFELELKEKSCVPKEEPEFTAYDEGGGGESGGGGMYVD